MYKTEDGKPAGCFDNDSIVDFDNNPNLSVGKNTDEYGVCDDNIGKYGDECLQNGELREYYCDYTDYPQGKCKYEEINCPPSKTCQNGKCQ